MWVGVTAYAVFAGADFGAGLWDLAAGDAEKGRPKRELIAHSIAPVWEANHVWLIYVLVVLWTGFPRVFAAIMSTLYIPLTLAATGVILRGSAFAFRKAATTSDLERLFGATFAASSVITPFFLGTVAGAVATTRVPFGNATGDAFGSWLNPTSIFGGVLAVATCVFLAAVFLCVDASKRAPALVDRIRREAIGAGLACGASRTRRHRDRAQRRAGAVPRTHASRFAARSGERGGRRGVASSAAGAAVRVRTRHRGVGGRSRGVGLGGRAVPVHAGTRCHHS